MEYVSFDLLLVIFDFLRLDDIQNLRTAYASQRSLSALVSLADDYIGRNRHRDLLPVDSFEMVNIIDPDYRQGGCTFYPARSLLRITDKVFESSVGPVTATFSDWTGWKLDLTIDIVDTNTGRYPQNWRWKWEPTWELGYGRSSLVSLMVESPERFTALQISSTNFLEFRSYYPGSVFQPRCSSIYRNILSVMSAQDRKIYSDLNGAFQPVFSHLKNLVTLILEAPSNYSHKNDEWWYQDKGESDMMGRKLSGAVLYPLERLYALLPLMPRLTTLHVALPVQQCAALADDADIVNVIMKSAPSLKALVLSEIPPRTSFNMERIDFAVTPYLQSFKFLSLESPSTTDPVWKPLYPNALGFEVTSPALIDIGSITKHFEIFSRSRDFNALEVHVLLGSEILGDGVSGGEFWWTTVRMKYSWHTDSARQILYSNQEFCHVWDPFDQYPRFPEDNYTDLFQLDDFDSL